MNKVHHDELEGKVIELSLQWDEHAKENIEYDAPFFRIVPNLHAAGTPIFLTIEDACVHAVLDDSGCRDCGSCRHYRLQPGGLLGTCDHPSQGAPPAPAAPRRSLPRAPAAMPGKGGMGASRCSIDDDQRRHTRT